MWHSVPPECSLTLSFSVHLAPTNVKNAAYPQICAQNATKQLKTILSIELLVLVSVPAHQAPIWIQTQANVYHAFPPASPAHRLLNAVRACRFPI